MKEKIYIVDGTEITFEQFQEMKKDKNIRLKEVDNGKYIKLKKLES